VSLNRNNRKHVVGAQKTCFPSEREEEGSSSSFITGAKRERVRYVKLREEQRGMEEKQWVTRSSKGWRPSGAGVAAAAPAEEG
jgi:hypothetical protein